MKTPYSEDFFLGRTTYKTMRIMAMAITAMRITKEKTTTETMVTATV